MAEATLKKDEELEEALTVMFGEHGAEGIVEKTKDTPPKKEGETAPPAKEGETTPPTVATPPAPAKQPAAAPAKVAKPKATPRTRKPEPAAPAINLEERDRIVAEAAARGAAVATQGKETKATDAPKETDDLNDTQRDTLSVMEFLGQKDTKYATLAERTKSYWKKEQEYAAKWQKENEGKEYDPKADEHADFYDKHEPEYVEADLEKARKDRDKAILDRSVDDKLDQKLSEKEQLDSERKRQTDEAHEIHEQAETAQVTLIKALVPEAEKFFTVEGKTKLTDAEWAALEEEDPSAAEVLREQTKELSEDMLEVERLNRYQRTYPPDSENPIHKRLGQFLFDCEDAIYERPEAEQVYKGRKFISQRDFGHRMHRIATSQDMTKEQKNAAARDLHQKHWMLEPRFFKAMLMNKHQKEAGQKLAKFRKVEERVKKRANRTETGAAPATTSTETAPATVQPAAAPAKKAAREVPPTIPGGGDIMPTGDKGNSNGASALETLTAIGI